MILNANFWRMVASADFEAVQALLLAQSAFSSERLLMEAWLAAKRDRQLELARHLWRTALQEPSDSALPEAGARLLKLFPELEAGQIPLRVAVLGSCATQFLVRALRLYLIRDGFQPVFYEAPFQQIRQELLDPESGLYQHRPDLVLILPDLEDYGPWSSAAAQTQTEKRVSEWAQLWACLDRLACPPLLIQTSYWSRRPDPLGHFGSTHAAGLTSSIRTLNAALVAKAGARVHWLDMAQFFNQWGMQSSFCPKYDYWTRQPLSLDATFKLAHESSRLIAAARGKRLKCLITDLDQTLWGGIAGEEGLDGLVSGPNSPEGEAFFAYQSYLKALKESGVLLAIASKNEPQLVKQVFESRHKDLALRLDDFAAFEVGWQPKSVALAQINKRLCINVDACLFIDDNPSELDQVRKVYPEVRVWQFPAEPSNAVWQLANCRFFDATSLSKEDRLRTQDLQQHQKRERLKQESPSLENFYRGLELKVRVEPAARHFERVLQLINKTNQFNVTGQRHSEQSLRQMLNRKTTLAFCVSVWDKFSDSGITGVLLGEHREALFEVELFLMSCRIIGKTVEKSAFEALVKLLAVRDVCWVEAQYQPTAQNGLTANLWESLGFECCSQDESGAKRLRLDLGQVRDFSNPFAVLQIDQEC